MHSAKKSCAACHSAMPEPWPSRSRLRTSHWPRMASDPRPATMITSQSVSDPYRAKASSSIPLVGDSAPRAAAGCPSTPHPSPPLRGHSAHSLAPAICAIDTRKTQRSPVPKTYVDQLIWLHTHDSSSRRDSWSGRSLSLRRRSMSAENVLLSCHACCCCSAASLSSGRRRERKERSFRRPSRSRIGRSPFLSACSSPACPVLARDAREHRARCSMRWRRSEGPDIL